MKIIYHAVRLPPTSPPFWRPSLYINSIAAGVKVHHNTHTMPYLSEKEHHYLSHP